MKDPELELQLSWLSSATKLRARWPQLVNAVAHIYRPFLLDNTSSLRLQTTNANSAAERTVILNDHEYRYTDFACALVEMEREIANRLLSGLSQGAVLHAAAVTDGDRTIILVGPSGAGKTTLALELVRRGFRYLTDEFVGLDPTRATLHPFPRTATLKQRWARLPLGELLELQASFGYRGFFRPERCSDLQPTPLRKPQVIFLERESNGRPHSRRLTSEEALVRLLCATFELVGRESIVWPAVSALAVRARSCVLVYHAVESDLDLAMGVLEAT